MEILIKIIDIIIEKSKPSHIKYGISGTSVYVDHNVVRELTRQDIIKFKKILCKY